MKIRVACVIESPEWESYQREFKKIANQACTAVIHELFSKHNFPCTFDIAIALGNDAFIRQLNKTFRGKAKPTNVLAFPSSDQPIHQVMKVLKGCYGDYPLGDIAIGADIVKKEAKKQNKAFDHHMAHLLVHGTLHLLGYDHEQVKEALTMESLEVKILKKLGINNPYL